MFNIKNYEYDCTRKCRLQSHAEAITAALTKRSIDDAQLAAFIAKTCCNFFDIQDGLGRSAVHLSASVSRYAVLEWLLNQGAIINNRDFESGSSPLHRALYYGSIDCAVVLLRYGASLELLDEDTRCPLQSICRLCDFRTVASLNDTLVWGSNRNYNLGIGNEQIANAPQSVDFFRKSNISIETMALGSYHSLFLDKKHYLYAVGHGKGGRLGVANENSLPAPKKVKVPIKNADEEIICISVSRKHSLVLTNRSLVFACGLNEDCQLGVRDAGEQLSNFKEVITLRDLGVTGLLRVIARDQHSIAYSEKCIYVWGANLGQFGINANTKSMPTPVLMKLPPRTMIQYVVSNNAATAVYTADNLILLYYNEKLRTIKPPNYEPLKSISIVGGDIKVSSKGTATALKLFMLTKTNVAFLWYENTQNFYRCSFSQIRITEIDKILYKSNQVLILSQGCVYKGKCNQVSLPAFTKDADNNKTSIDLWQDHDLNRTEISRDHMIRIDLQRVQNIDRAVDIFCNDDFSSFAVLQESQMKYFKAPTLQRAEYNFKKLYHDACETDAVHDLVFHVDGEIFAAHKLIIYSRAPGLRELIRAHLDKHINLKYELFTGKMFEIILKFIYTNYLPNADDIDCIGQSLGPDNPNDNFKVCALFCEHVARFQLTELAAYLSDYLNDQYFPSPSRTHFRFNRLRRKDFPELYDVRILCEAEQEIQAHKCILVARLEYFEMMFMHTWAEHSTINLSTVPIEYMEPIIDFIYSADIEHIRRQNYSETFLYNMIVFCDQFFIERLQEVCELLILDKIRIRKCGEMLDFAHLYNCKLLKKGSMDFICQNLSRVLAYRSIEQCDPEALKCLNEHYRNMFNDVFDYRMITPDSTAIEDELLISFVDDFTVNLDYRMDEETQQKNALKQKQKELRNKQDVRQYEREAISSMMRTLSVSETQQQPQPQSNADKSAAVQHAEKVGTQLQNESKSWLKVVDKKEHKRKNTELAFKINATATYEEDNAPITTTPRSSESKRQTPEKEITTPRTPEAIISKSYNLDLSHLTPQTTQKLSQKQRKRLSSESKSSPGTSNWRAPVLVQPTTPVAVPNAWGVNPQQTPPVATYLNDDFYSPPTGSVNDPTSFANMMRSNKSTPKSATNTTTEQSNSFSKILEDERRQREQYDRLRNKSLVLTQIEETAITELREFYNADNISDEYIIVERKNRPRTLNFSTWQRH